MIHNMLASVHNGGTYLEGKRLDKSTVETKTKKFVSFSSTLNKDQLRRQLHGSSLQLPANIGTVLMFVGMALLLGYISYWFFGGIRQDYGPVVVARDNCQMKEFWTDYSDNRPPQPWQMEVCDYTYEDKNYADASTFLKWIVRGGCGAAFAWFAMLASQATYRRLLAMRDNVRAHRSPKPSDAVRELDLDGYRWDMLRASLNAEFDRYDGSCFDDADDTWNLFIESLTNGDKLGVALDEPTSKYLVNVDNLATDEKYNKPLKEERDKAVMHMAGLATAKIFPLLVGGVNAKRAQADRLHSPDPDQDFLEETNRDNEERNAAMNIAAAYETVI